MLLGSGIAVFLWTRAQYLRLCSAAWRSRAAHSGLSLELCPSLGG